MAGPIRASITADAREFTRAVDKVEAGAEDMARETKRAGDRMEYAFDNAASSADSTASASSQAAGGIGDIAGALESTGVISETTAMQMEVTEAAIMGVTGASDLANLAFEKMPGLQKAIGAATKFMLGPFGIILAVVAAVAAIFVLLYKNNDQFRAFVDEKLVPALKRLWQMFVTAIKPAIDQLWQTIKTAVLPALAEAWEIIQAKVVPVLKRLWTVFQTRILPVLVKVAQFVLGKVVPALVVFYAKYLAAVIRVITKVISTIAKFVRGIVNLASNVRSKASQIAGFFGNMRDRIAGRIDSIVSYVKRLPGRIVRAVGGLGRTLWNAGVSLLRGLRDGISYAWDTYVKPLLSRVTNMIPDWKGPIERDRKLLAPAGAAIMEGLADSMDTGFNTRVRRTLKNATNAIGGTSFAAPSSSSNGAGVTVNVTVQGIVGDPVATGREIAKAVGAYVGAGGRVRIA